MTLFQVTLSLLVTQWVIFCFGTLERQFWDAFGTCCQRVDHIPPGQQICVKESNFGINEERNAFNGNAVSGGAYFQRERSQALRLDRIDSGASVLGGGFV